MNRSLLKPKTKLITNSLIDLGLEEDEGKGKGRYFVSKFIEAGLAHYKELGDILITKETLDKFIQTMVGCPVIIDHIDVNDKNVDKLRVGVISRVWYNEMDGWYYCEGILTDSKAIDLVKNKGWSVSCSYSFVSDDTQKTYHGKPIDMEFTDGEFLHLAIVETPRYEGANIVVNKKDDDIEWITVKGNHIPVKKGQSKDEAVKEFLKGKEGKKNTNDSKVSKLETKLTDLKSQYNEAMKEYWETDEDKRDAIQYKVDGLKDEIIDTEEKLDVLKKENKESSDGKEDKQANNSIGDITMAVLNDLTDFIKKVVSNEKEDEMKKVDNEDKRKLIDEVGGILKDKVDEELWRTVIGKLEKIAYNPSEDSKTDNKDDEEDKKEAKNKCKNEEDKKEDKKDDKKVEDEEDKKEDLTKNEDDDEEEKTENKKVKNSMKDFVMGGKSNYEEKPLYTSRAKRLEEGNKY